MISSDAQEGTTSAPDSWNGNSKQKRKRQAQMLKGKWNRSPLQGDASLNNSNNKKTPSTAPGIVSPGDIIATSAHGECVVAGVWGTLLEVNTTAWSQKAFAPFDPLLDGYLAVVLPTGPFPPPSLTEDAPITVNVTIDQHERDEEIDMRHDPQS
jgi:hypothetical protein